MNTKAPKLTKEELKSRALQDLSAQLKTHNDRMQVAANSEISLNTLKEYLTGKIARPYIADLILKEGKNFILKRDHA